MGNWRSVQSQFRRWARAGVWDALFRALSQDPDFEYVLVDATICKMDVDAACQKGGLKLPVLAAPKGGLTIARRGIAKAMSREGPKIHAAVDALGLPLRIVIPPANGATCRLIDGLTDAQHVIMDAAYDADHLRAVIADDLGATAHVKRNPTRREDRFIDWTL